MGGTWPRCPPSDGSHPYLYPSSDDAHVSTVANTAANGRIAQANQHARPRAIRHPPTIADAAGAYGGAANTHQHAESGAIGYTPAN